MPPIPPKRFATRFVYGSGPTTLDFDIPTGSVFPQFIPITGSNLVYSGKREILFNRFEVSITLVWQNLSTAMMQGLTLWFANHAGFGYQTVIVLDRANTCAGQWEYDFFNLYFSRAELISGPLQFQPQPLPVSRYVLELPSYAATLTFRQGMP